ncbi:MAG: UDP-2,3-diacylglucosamine diphosphatase [Bacteroidia bacterium]|nr:UDP-2,3-diacylglucosamine diphosphatase [Bacteroidia bacterium]
MRIYFASDTHLGAHIVGDRKGQELRFVAWLDKIKSDADAIYLLGDIFDYWFEYKSVVPKGYVRFLSKLDELTQMGIDIHIFTGNHDVWMFSYLQEEIGVKVHTPHISTTWDNKHFFIGHGDGLGKYDKPYKLLKWIFQCRPIQIIYSWLHPDLANWIANTWSVLSRKSNSKKTKFHSFMGPDKEIQIRYVNDEEEANNGKKYDYYIFGHRHILADYSTKYGAHALIIGDWLYNFSYALWDGESLKLYQVNPDNPTEEPKCVSDKFSFK